MRKIEKRGVFCLILAALLGLGLAVFCFQFIVYGGDWASYPYNRHLYSNSGQLKGGTILDPVSYTHLLSAMIAPKLSAAIVSMVW